ncbi:UNVERIFIED_CONTAM: hypothetical protein FKN15_014587 [Acipenser sinensis]
MTAPKDEAEAKVETHTVSVCQELELKSSGQLFDSASTQVEEVSLDLDSYSAASPLMFRDMLKACLRDQVISKISGLGLARQEPDWLDGKMKDPKDSLGRGSSKSMLTFSVLAVAGGPLRAGLAPVFRHGGSSRTLQSEGVTSFPERSLEEGGRRPFRARTYTYKETLDVDKDGVRSEKKSGSILLCGGDS